MQLGNSGLADTELGAQVLEFDALEVVHGDDVSFALRKLFNGSGERLAYEFWWTADSLLDPSLEPRARPCSHSLTSSSRTTDGGAIDVFPDSCASAAAARARRGNQSCARNSSKMAPRIRTRTYHSKLSSHCPSWRRIASQSPLMPAAIKSSAEHCEVTCVETRRRFVEPAEHIAVAVARLSDHLHSFDVPGVCECAELICASRWDEPGLASTHADVRAVE